MTNTDPLTVEEREAVERLRAKLNASGGGHLGPAIMRTEDIATALASIDRLTKPATEEGEMPPFPYQSHAPTTDDHRERARKVAVDIWQREPFAEDDDYFTQRFYLTVDAIASALADTIDELKSLARAYIDFPK